MSSNSMKSECPRLNISPELSSNPRISNHRPWYYGIPGIKLIPRIPSINYRIRSSGSSSSSSSLIVKRSRSSSSSSLIVKRRCEKIKSNQRLSRFSKAQFLNQRLKKMTTLSKNQDRCCSSRVSRKHAKMQSYELPESIMAEVLKRLPVKYILRCMCVQKSWYHLIRSPMFISLQLDYQKLVNSTQNYHHPKYLLFRDLHVDKLTVRFDDVQCQNYCNIKFLPGLPKKTTWFAMSHGLICVSALFSYNGDHNRNIYLWNPLIQKYKTLPDSPLPVKQNLPFWEGLAFGFVPEVNDYVVVHIIKPYLGPDSHSVIIGVYSLNTNSWKKFTQDNVFISRIRSKYDGVVFVNSAAYWVGVTSDKHRILMRFDVKTNVLSMISLPDWVADRSFTCPIPVIHLFGQSIAYFVWEHSVRHFDMWLLKNDPTDEFTWEKKMCVGLSNCIMPQVLGVRNNGEPILAESYKLITYNLDDHEANDFVDSWKCWTKGYVPPYVISPFVESLVLLNTD